MVEAQCHRTEVRRKLGKQEKRNRQEQKRKSSDLDGNISLTLESIVVCRANTHDELRRAPSALLTPKSMLMWSRVSWKI